MVFSQEVYAEEGFLCSSPDDDSVCERKNLEKGLKSNESLISEEICTNLCKKMTCFTKALNEI